MPIIRRTPDSDAATTSKWTHHIVGKYFTAGIRVVDRRVVAAEPQLHWTIGQRFDKITELSNSRGDTIEKL